MKKVLILICAINALTCTYLYSQIFDSIVKQNPDCYGFSNGSIELNITGGVEPYTIIWTNDSGIFATDTNFVDNLQAGKYWFDIIDFNGLPATDTVYLTTFQITTIDEITDAPCYASNGTIKITPLGGRDFYFGYWRRMVWNPSLNAMILDATWQDSSHTNIDTNYFSKSYPKGFYILTIVDSSGLGCSIVKNIEIKEPTSPISLDEITDAPCYASNGTIKITPLGGRDFYFGYWRRMVWNPSLNAMILDATWQDSSHTNIDTNYFSKSYPKGFYILTIVDSSGLGCSILKNIEIKEPTSPISLQETHTNNICKYDTSALIQVNAYGGTKPYLFSWSNGKTTSLINNLRADLYTVTVSDSKGCTINESINIDEPFQKMLIISDKNDVSCRDNHDGSVSIQYVENSIAPYTYKWSNSETVANISNLDADIYIVTVTDGNNCNAIDTFDVKLTDIDCITINNVITPDGNGKNDYWIIDNIHLYPECDVSIFDRWGNIVFNKTAGYDNLWNADYKGSTLNSGDYYYIVNLNQSNYKIYTGPVKIIK